MDALPSRFINEIPDESVEKNEVDQFINKLDGPIGERDRKKFEEIQDLLGMCIDNTNTITKTVGVTLEFNSTMEKINNIMEDSMLKSEEKKEPSTEKKRRAPPKKAEDPAAGAAGAAGATGPGGNAQLVGGRPRRRGAAARVREGRA